MQQWVRSAMWVLGGGVGLMLLVGWLDSPPSDHAEAYCQKISGTHPTIYQTWVEGQQPNLGNYFDYGTCMELQREGLMFASCDVKTKWYQEKFRHEEEADKIANGERSIYNVGQATLKKDDGSEEVFDVRELRTERNNQQIEAACGMGS